MESGRGFLPRDWRLFYPSAKRRRKSYALVAERMAGSFYSAHLHVHSILREGCLCDWRTQKLRCALARGNRGEILVSVRDRNRKGWSDLVGTYLNETSPPISFAGSSRRKRGKSFPYISLGVELMALQKYSSILVMF